MFIIELGGGRFPATRASTPLSITVLCSRNEEALKEAVRVEITLRRTQKSDTRFYPPAAD